MRATSWASSSRRAAERPLGARLMTPPSRQDSRLIFSFIFSQLFRRQAERRGTGRGEREREEGGERGGEARPDTKNA